MTLDNIDIDEEACAEVMRRFDFSNEEEAVNFALRSLAYGTANSAVRSASLQEARAMRGIGWEGDLNQMRSSRSW